MVRFWPSTIGYVGFAEEVRAQEKEMDLRFDYVIVCTVTGSTHAGMVVGFAADGRQRNVIGIDASCTPLQTKAQVLDIALKTSELVGGKTITAEDIVLNEELPGLRCALEEDRGGNSPVCAVGRHDH
jgi:1-aminocyclopropane-1-carboxylate deaminase